MEYYDIDKVHKEMCNDFKIGERVKITDNGWDEKTHKPIMNGGKIGEIFKIHKPFLWIRFDGWEEEGMKTGKYPINKITPDGVEKLDKVNNTVCLYEIHWKHTGISELEVDISKKSKDEHIDDYLNDWFITNHNEIPLSYEIKDYVCPMSEVHS